MKLDYSWKALFKPGEATDYFNLSDSVPLQTGAPGFNINNAWWLAEISRLIYQHDFHNKHNLNLGCFEYETIGFIDNKNTSTHVALLKVNGIDNKGHTTPCLVVAFRGTDHIDDWNNNVHAYQTPFGELGNVHDGFKNAYLSIKKELHGYLNNHLLPTFITGHSLGAALATLTTAEIVNNPNFDSCYTFGSPRTGDPAFVNALKDKRIYRVINNCDVVTTVPLSFANIKYKHSGFSHLLNNNGDHVEESDEEAILNYQKDKLLDLKEYAILELFSKNIKNIKDNLPPVLADHAPINYVLALENLIKTSYN
jgi:triacylglycerol lipase